MMRVRPLCSADARETPEMVPMSEQELPPFDDAEQVNQNNFGVAPDVVQHVAVEYPLSSGFKQMVDPRVGSVMMVYDPILRKWLLCRIIEANNEQIKFTWLGWYIRIHSRT